MSGSKLAESRSLPMIAVFEVFSGFMRAARAEINAQHRLGLREPAPVDEFVRSKRVGFRTDPGEIQATRPLR